MGNNGTWKKGQSGNPAGKKPGSNKLDQLRLQAFETFGTWLLTEGLDKFIENMNSVLPNQYNDKYIRALEFIFPRQKEMKIEKSNEEIRKIEIEYTAVENKQKENIIQLEESNRHLELDFGELEVLKEEKDQGKEE
jgi:hypothetical protein